MVFWKLSQALQTNDVLNGSAGDDKLTGAEGDDILIGGDGYDTAVYSGNQADYKFSVNSAGQVLVQDINMADGNEGTDTLTGVEVASFAEGPFTISVVGGEFPVNTFTPGFQGSPSVTGLANGGYVVTWMSWNQDGSESGIYGQRYAANGAPEGNEFLINTTTAGSQESPSVAALINGGFVVAWDSRTDITSHSVFARQYNAAGVPQGEETPVSTIGNGSSVIPLITGGFVVIWQSSGGISARQYDTTGAPQSAEITIVNRAPDRGTELMSATALPDGGYLITWLLYGTTETIFARKYDVHHTPIGNEIIVSSSIVNKTGSVREASVATLPDGGYVVTWRSANNNGTDSILARQYDANNALTGTEITISSVVNAAGLLLEPSVATLSGGGYVVAWLSHNNQNSTSSILARQYDANNNPKGNEFHVNTFTAGWKGFPSVTALADGGFVVTWDSGGQDGDGSAGIYGQRYDANGNPVQQTVQLKPQNVLLNTAPQLTGTKAVLSDGIEDTAYTVSATDLLKGWTDIDEDVLSIKNLVVDHGAVTDNGDGTYTYTPDENYNGADSFSYRVNDGLEDSNVATVNIVVNAVNDIPQAIDDSGQISEDATIIVSFDDLMANDIDVDGTAKTIIAVDTTGTAGHAVIDATNRTISYSADADEFDLLATGDTAIDSFKYTLQGSSGEIDTAIVTINVLGVNDGNLNIAGTVQPDTLTGTPGEDRIKGNNGNDIIDGGEGADELLGENGDDNLTGGNSIDKLFGGNGNDKLNGGNGNDWLNGEKGNDILTGSLGSDVFLFAKSGGNDIITDFTHGADKIQIAADIGIVNFNQIKITGGTDSSGVVYATINLGSGGQVTLTGVPSSVLDATDFIFPV